MPILVENDHNTPISQIPTKTGLFDIAVKDGTAIKMTTGSGTYNIVYTFTFDNGQRKSVRVSINPLIEISQAGISRFTDQDSLEDGEMLEEINQTKSNWIEAARANIAPEIFFYGYIKREEYGTTYLYPAMISTGYDTDLSNYYNNPKFQGHTDKCAGILTDTDKEIANQIIYMLNESLKLNLKVICFDIKPANCVINTYTDGRKPEVRLIDWDADWCKNYDIQLSKHRDTSPFNYISILTKMLMAAHFYVHCNWNIFSDYFSNGINDEYNEYGEPPILSTIKPALELIFCNQEYSSFNLMAAHYFFNGVNRPSVETCKLMFNEIFDWSTKINDGKRPHGCLAIDMRDSTGHIGGKIHKYKKKRNKKTTKKRKRQLKKNTKKRQLKKNTKKR